MPDTIQRLDGDVAKTEMADRADREIETSVSPPSQSIATLRKRAEFLRVARGQRQHTTAFLLQGRSRAPGSAEGSPRVGFTCSKKLGNAVARNRAKRRLREAARLVIPKQGEAGWDYVLVGRQNVTSEIDFGKLVGDLEKALQRMHSLRERDNKRIPEEISRKPSG